MTVKAYTIPEAPDKYPSTPGALEEFYDWHRRTDGVMDKELVDLSKNLTFCNMNADYDRPPTFSMIGCETQSRFNFGSDWADSTVKTQRTPIQTLDEVSAAGYMNSLTRFWNYDIIEFTDPRYFGTYRRLIMPIRHKLGYKPTYFAMMLDFMNFENKH